MTADSHAEHSVIESPITEARPNSLLTSPSGDQALTSLSFKGYGNRTRSNPGNESLGYQLLRGKKAMEDCPKAKITAPTDAIIKIVKTTICGTDLHILKGDVQ